MKKHLKVTRLFASTVLLAFIFLMSCSKDDSPDPIAEMDTLLITASSTSIEEGEAVQFAVTVNNVTVSDAVIYVEGATIANYEHVFVQAGTYRVMAKKEGYQDSAEVTITVIEEQIDIYVAGYETINGKQVATYWKNGVPQPLSDGTSNSESTALVVHNSDVYVLVEDGYALKYWKNDQENIIYNQLGTYGNARDMMVTENGDVYIAGSRPVGGAAVATYWKNGVATSLIHDNYSYATGIAISGNDVYVSGFSTETNTGSSKPIALYWKNGVPVTLTDGSLYGYATKLAVVGNDVHVVGYEHDEVGNWSARYWKNGDVIPLPNGVDASDIFMVGDDAYVVGRAGQTVKYWKNGVHVEVGPGHFVYGITVFNNNVYTAGSFGTEDINNQRAVYWKNSTMTILSDDTASASAHAIVVVGR